MARMGNSRKTLKEWLCFRNIVDFPPLWTVVMIIISVMLSRYTVPLRIGFPLVVSIGIVLNIIAFSIMLWCAYTLVRAKTPALPHNEAEDLVTHGLYRWSRNPIYLADIILLISFAFIYQTLWPVLLVPVLYLILKKRFIIPEEAMLKRHFPEAFKSWAKGTRRWI